jgi:hypothetical protein
MNKNTTIKFCHVEEKKSRGCTPPSVLSKSPLLRFSVKKETYHNPQSIYLYNALDI